LCHETLVWNRLHHPSILPFLGIDDKTFHPHVCLISPLLKNKTIMAYRAEKGPQNISIPKLILEITEGLQYLHSESIVHGDLHKGNILIDDEGHVKLIDFGLAYLVGETTTMTGVADASGAIAYKAPELYSLCDGDLQKKSAQTDVFAFASVCYEVRASSGWYA
ncbi:kinase-like domain-containing protein, partial [Mycena rosella]